MQEEPKPKAIIEFYDSNNRIIHTVNQDFFGVGVKDIITHIALNRIWNASLAIYRSNDTVREIHLFKITNSVMGFSVDYANVN